MVKIAFSIKERKDCWAVTLLPGSDAAASYDML